MQKRYINLTKVVKERFHSTKFPRGRDIQEYGYPDVTYGNHIIEDPNPYLF